MKIDRSNWRLVKLGDVARNLKDTVNIDEYGLEYYLGGEHFNTDDLHTNGRGVIEGSTIGPAFTMRFQPEHVLLVSRNPHLRKMAVADFMGICSNVTYVCETKSELLLQEYLPFIMRSSAFWNFAEANKRGSTNFYLNWSDFARYEFLLPPIDEQKRIAEVLWAADDVIVKHKQSLTALVDLKQSLLDDFCEKISDEIVLGDFLDDIRYGSSVRATGYIEGAVPILRIPNISNGEINFEKMGYICIGEEDKHRFSLNKGDLLLIRSNGNPDYVGRMVCVGENAKGYVFASYLIRLRCKKSLNSDYLRIHFNHDKLRTKLLREIKSSAGNYNLNTQGIKQQKIPYTDINEQEKLVFQVKAIEKNMDEIKKHIQNTGNIITDILNIELGGIN